MIEPHQANDPELDPLTRIAIAHGTDKWGAHFYTPIYHNLFSHLRERPLRVLEIGVGGFDCKTIGGASLSMWAEYFPHALITGIDIAEKQMALDARIRMYRGSQDDPAFLKRVCDERGPFDIIVDDGSHVPKHVVTSFNLLFPGMTDGGLYVIEDVQTAFWPMRGGSILDGGETMKLARTLLEYLNHAEISVIDRARTFPVFGKQVRSVRAFHNIIAIEKGDNLEPSNSAFDPNNAHARRALRMIEQQLDRSPTALGLANLIDLYVLGGNQTKAKETSVKAQAMWPHDPTLLLAAYNAAVNRHDLEASIAHLARLLQIEPDHAALRQAMQEARAEQQRRQRG